MPDDQRAVTGPTDTIGPWNIKSVPTATRQAVIRAAQRENLTVGQWLERRVNEWTEDGSPLAVSATDKPADDAARLRLIQEAIAAAVALANAPTVPPGFRRRANRLLRDMLPAPLRTPAAAPLPAIEDGAPAAP
jgi:hypothetical protein